MDACIENTERLLANLKATRNVEKWYAEIAEDACFALVQRGRDPCAKSMLFSEPLCFHYIGLDAPYAWKSVLPNLFRCGRYEVLAEAGPLVLQFRSKATTIDLLEIDVDWPSIARRKGNIVVKAKHATVYLEKLEKGRYLLIAGPPLVLASDCPAGPAIGALCAAFSRGPHLLSYKFGSGAIWSMKDRIYSAEKDSDHVKRASEDLERAFESAKKLRSQR